MNQTQCRWGILGTANIARKNWQAILDAGNASLVAVASRDSAKSRQFIEECQTAAPHPCAPTALGNSNLVLGGRIDPHWPFVSLQTQTVMEACLQSARNGSAMVAL